MLNSIRSIRIVAQMSKNHYNIRINGSPKSLKRNERIEL